MNIKIVLLIFCIFLVDYGITLGNSTEQKSDNITTIKETWRIQDELKHIKKNLGNDDRTDKLDDINQIQDALTLIEKALGHAEKTDAASRIEQENSQKSLRQMDDSLNSLKLDELNRIEKIFGYDAWIKYCEKSTACKNQELNQH